MTDIFGQIMRDAAMGQEAIHEIERDDGLIMESLGSQYVAPFEDWPNNQKQSISLAKGHILDVGCGAGRVSLYLQEKANMVTGIDISEGAIKVSQERGVKDARLMNACELDFEDDLFDTILLFGNGFGLPGRPNEVVATLKEFHRIAKSDAIILAESRNPRATDNPKHLAYHQKNIKAGESVGLLRLRLRYEGNVGEWFNLLLADDEFMAELGAKAGWNLERTIGEPNLYVGVLRKM